MKDNLTMKTLPESEQPYYICERYGAKMLTDAQLLAVIIKTGTRELRVTQVAENLIKELGDKKLAGLMFMSSKEMEKLPGIGRIKAMQLECVCELAKRISESKYRSKIAFNSPRSIADYYMQRMRFSPTEKCYVLYCNGAGALLGEKEVSSGDQKHSVVPLREIFIEGIRLNATGFVLLHNHPGGNPKPSSADVALTRKFKEASKLLDTALIGHIIIGDNEYFSFLEANML
jgi:DNA repair protein RadC